MIFSLEYQCFGALFSVVGTLGSVGVIGVGTLGSFEGTGWLFVLFVSG
jgi:hypothetical protein